MSDPNALDAQLKTLQERVAALERGEHRHALLPYLRNVPASLNPLHYWAFNGLLPSYIAELESHAGAVPYSAIGAIGADGRFGGKGVLIASDGINLCTNPSFETNTTSWASSWGDTLAISSLYSKFGSYSLAVTEAGATGMGCYNDITVAAGTTYTVSAWVFVPWDYTWTATVQLRAYDGASYTTMLSSVQVPVASWGTWVRVSITVVPTVTTMRIMVFTGAASAGNMFYVDGVMVEAASYLSEYIDGSLGNGHSWSGTPHASTSSRVDGELKYLYPAMSLKGSIGFWFRVPPLSPPMSGGWRLLDFRTSASSNAPMIYIPQSTTILRLYVMAGNRIDISSSALTDGGWHHALYTWDWITGQHDLYLDGVRGTQYVTGVHYPVATTYIDVGQTNKQYNYSAVFNDLALFDYVLTPTQVNQIYNCGTPLGTQALYNFPRTPDGGFYIDLIAGETISRGHVLYVKSASGADGRVWKNPIDGDMPIGVAYNGAVAGNRVRVVEAGIAYVLPDAALTATRGYVIYSSSTAAGLVQEAATVPADASHFREVGHWLDTGSGAGALTRAIIHFN